LLAHRADDLLKPPFIGLQSGLNCLSGTRGTDPERVIFVNHKF
jgi:hypothetical protein